MNKQELIISIHAPAKGATRPNHLHRTDHVYFNPRSREGSDSIKERVAKDMIISIHAPAKGATESLHQKQE